MTNIEDDISRLINKIYKNGLLCPTSDSFVTEEYLADKLVEEISIKCNVNIVRKRCPNCKYCYQIAVSSGKEMPIIPDYSPANTQRKNWIKRYGDLNYQMYIALSKLSKYAMIYWTKYSYCLFMERLNHVYVPPSELWEGIDKCAKEIMQKMNIKTIDASLILRQYNVKYKGEIEGLDTQPSLIKLLFSEEMH